MLLSKVLDGRGVGVSESTVSTRSSEGTHLPDHRCLSCGLRSHHRCFQECTCQIATAIIHPVEGWASLSRQCRTLIGVLVRYRSRHANTVTHDTLLCLLQYSRQNQHQRYGEALDDILLDKALRNQSFSIAFRHGRSYVLPAHPPHFEAIGVRATS